MKTRAIIVDLDGTLADSQHVREYTDEKGSVDWRAWMLSNKHSLVNEWCREIVNSAVVMGTQIIFLTARTGDDVGIQVTDEWLKTNGFSGYKLLMRKPNDYRPDYIIKHEIFLSDIAPYYDILFALDDKRRVIDMWRQLGIPALHCADH